MACFDAAEIEEIYEMKTTCIILSTRSLEEVVSFFVFLLLNVGNRKYYFIFKKNTIHIEFLQNKPLIYLTISQ